jgi:hypothetical protein
MVRPTEGPGGPLEGPGRALETLPPEMLQHTMVFLEPEDLMKLRDFSEEMRAQVDDYLEHLIESGKLRDRSGDKLRPGFLEPTEVLQNWANNWLLEDYQPPSEADFANIVKSWDETLWVFEEYNEGQPNTITWYEPILYSGTQAAAKLEAELNIYVQGLLEAGRIVDAADNPLPTDQLPSTQLSDVMQYLRSGNARWEPPPEPNA